jgi:hypothetical protein
MSFTRRRKDGRVLCNPHARSGAPTYHTAGCVMCELARAKGIIRPDRPERMVGTEARRLMLMRASTIPRQRRGVFQ